VVLVPVPLVRLGSRVSSLHLGPVLLADYHAGTFLLRVKEPSDRTLELRSHIVPALK
jgi:hypothetical protein